MNWLIVAIFAYFFMAIVNVADKFIVEKVIPGPRTYAFLVGLFGAIVVLAAPWFLAWPGWGLFFFNLFTGALFAGGIFFLYSALRGNDASKIFTLVGGTVPVFVVLFSLIFFREKFSFFQWLAIYYLVLGTLMIASISSRHSIWQEIKKALGIKLAQKWQSVFLSLVAAFFFASFWTASKQAYNLQDFGSAFIWIRLGTFAAVLVFLLKKNWRQEIKKDLKQSKKNKKSPLIFFGTQGLGAAGSILQNYAVALGSVALVTSLQGLQYAFILVFTFLITLFNPKILKEDNSALIVWQKILAIILIALGLYFIAR
ncbi:MAG: DMT family transporter [Patescibacteria group bacterium]|nr:DMT family transporter [Patescibacteria group bacterium]